VLKKATAHASGYATGAPPGLPVILLVAWPGTRRRIVVELVTDVSGQLE